MRLLYTFSECPPNRINSKIWLAQGGGYLIKADLRVEVDNVPQTTTSGVPVSVSQTIHWTMTLDAINQAFSIAAPVAGTPGPAQPTAPIQPSAPIQQAVPQATVDAVAPCQVQIRGRFLYIFDGTSDMCIRTIQGANASSTFRYGYWGNFLLAVNQAGQVYVQAANGQWQLAGQIVNADGTTGSLWDRCLRGSIAACNQLRGNFDSAIQDWTQLYPEDWFNAAKPEP